MSLWRGGRYHATYYQRLFADIGIEPADAIIVDDPPQAIDWASQFGARTVLQRRLPGQKRPVGSKAWLNFRLYFSSGVSMRR